LAARALSAVLGTVIVGTTDAEVLQFDLCGMTLTAASQVT